PRCAAVRVGAVGSRDSAGGAVVWRARGDVSESGRQLHLSARSDLTALRLSLWLATVCRDSNRHDRRGRGCLRPLYLGALARPLAANWGANFWAGGALTLSVLPVVGAAMVGSLFSMDAWNNVGFASGELTNPEKDVPFAMGAGVLIVTTLYVLANVSYLVVLPQDAIAHAPQDRVGTAALQAMFGAPGLYIMAIAIMISTFGCNNGLILSGARVYYA